MIDRGVKFLVARQDSDGLWRDFLTLGGQGADWPTGFIGAQLATATSHYMPLERAADSLARCQHDDGGWGYHTGVPTDADSTACVLLFLAALGRRGPAVERAAASLARHQDPYSGGVSTYREPGPIRSFMGVGEHIDLSGWCGAHTEVTATAGRAFAALGLSFKDQATAAWRYVRSRQRAEGCWHSYWWTSPHYPTMQAVELAHAMGDTVAMKHAAAWALREQRKDGGWTAPGATTSAVGTALLVSVLLRCSQDRESVARAVKRLARLQNPDGGWPSHPIMRIPPPDLAEPNDHRSWRIDGLGTGVIIRDQHRLFTTAVCIGALAQTRSESQ